jgi:uncharacterized membrane protein YkvA (DUF1232 family)
MLRRDEYAAFASKINKAMHWSNFSFEMFMFYFVALAAPPLAAHLMVFISAVYSVALHIILTF